MDKWSPRQLHGLSSFVHTATAHRTITRYEGVSVSRSSCECLHLVMILCCARNQRRRAPESLLRGSPTQQTASLLSSTFCSCCWWPLLGPAPAGKLWFFLETSIYCMTLRRQPKHPNNQEQLPLLTLCCTTSRDTASCRAVAFCHHLGVPIKCTAPTLGMLNSTQSRLEIRRARRGSRQMF